MDVLRTVLADMVQHPATTHLSRLFWMAITVLASYLGYVLARGPVLGLFKRLITHTKTRWDDALIATKFLDRLAFMVPSLLVAKLARFGFPANSMLERLLFDGAMAAIILVSVLAADAFLTACHNVYRQFPNSSQMPIRGFIQIIKIALYFVAVILIIALLLDKSPAYLLSGLGALTAVLLLVFKDSILGFVAGVQLTSFRLLALGDWISMPQYGADGDVIDIALTTVKIQNWDKTIVSIPTYALISESFQNWRGMMQSGGRRIKRAVNIDVQSVRFCTDEMLERFARIQYIRDYLDNKKEEIAKYNREKGVDETCHVNGRRLTNLGTFRAYVVAYLRNHPMINQDMTFLVRHLPPGEHGLPIELYVFSKDKAWANYEAIQADIFDHLLAVIPEFDLRVFQNPSGADLQALRG